MSDTITVVDLLVLGRTLEIDKDHLLSEINGGELLLIHLAPRIFAKEVHKGTERIVVLEGSFVLETEDEQFPVARGQMLTIPPGIEHRFGDRSDAVILAAFSKATGL